MNDICESVVFIDKNSSKCYTCCERNMYIERDFDMQNRYEILETKINTGQNAKYRFKAKDLLKNIIIDGEIENHEVGAFEEFVNNSSIKIEKKDFALALVYANPNFLYLMKERTLELCKMAVESPNSVIGIKFVPEEYQTDEIVKTAILKSAKNLRHIVHQKRTSEICNIAVDNGERIKFVPTDVLSLDMCLKGVNIKAGDIIYVPDKYLLPVFYEMLSDKTNFVAVEYEEYKNGKKYEENRYLGYKLKKVFDRVKKLERQNEIEEQIEKNSMVHSGTNEEKNDLLVEKIIIQASRLEELDQEEKELLEKIEKIRVERTKIIKSISSKKGMR